MSKQSNADKVKIVTLSEVASRRGVTVDAILNEAIEGKVALYIREGLWAQHEIHSGDITYTEFGDLRQVDKYSLNDILTLGEKNLQFDLHIYSDNPDFSKATKISRRQYKEKTKITRTSLLMIDDGIADTTLKAFKGMDGLRWDEIEILLSDRGLLIITARDRTARITSGEFGLLNKNTGAPNQTYELLISFANNRPVAKDRKMTVTRVRDLLKKNFGISKTPIELNGKLYSPKFKISFQDYKKNRGEHGTVSLETGKFLDAVADPNATDPQDIYENYEIGADRDDAADKWLAVQDPHHPENKK